QLYANSSTIATLNFTNATGTNLTLSGYLSVSGVGTFATTTVFSSNPLAKASSSLLQFGPNVIQGGNSASGTYLGVNPVAFAGDFLNFQTNSSTQFVVSATGTATLAGNLTIAGFTSSSQEYVNSSTITGLRFTSATGTNLTITNLLDVQGNRYITSTVVADPLTLSQLYVNSSATIVGLNFTSATGTNLNVTTLVGTTVSSTGLTFSNATGSGNLQVGRHGLGSDDGDECFFHRDYFYERHWVELFRPDRYPSGRDELATLPAGAEFNSALERDHHLSRRQHRDRLWRQLPRLPSQLFFPVPDDHRLLDRDHFHERHRERELPSGHRHLHDPRVLNGHHLYERHGLGSDDGHQCFLDRDHFHERDGVGESLGLGPHFFLPTLCQQFHTRRPQLHECDAILTVASTSNIFVILDTGLIGVGTSSPTALFHIVGATPAAATTASNTLVVVGGTGGAGTSGATGGVGGLISLTTGNGGDQNNSALLTSGKGGAFSITTGNGGLNQGTLLAAGAGGAITILTGNGGNSSSTGINGGGAAGAITIQGGVGGTATTTENGGNGGSLTLLGGAGGSTASTTNLEVGGNGGSITLNPGAGGNGAASGTTGNIILASLRGLVGIGTSSPSDKLTIGGRPGENTTSSLLFLGPSGPIRGGSVSGTVIGSNFVTFNGDFINFQVNSSTQFRVSATGTVFLNGGLFASTTVSSTGITFTNATGSGNLTVLGITSSSQEFVNSSTITGLRFTNATGTTLVMTTVSSTGITFTNATGSGVMTVTNVSSTGITFTNATGSGALTMLGGSNTRLGTTTNAATNAILTVASTSNIFVILDTGLIGVGTSSPTALFHIIGATPADGKNASDTLVVVGGTGGGPTIGGKGGLISLTTGNGGAVGTTGDTSGAGGAFTIRTGNGGLNEGFGSTGAGGNISIISGNGGQASTSNAGNAGAAGTITISGGTGGVATSTLSGGAGGSISISAGPGGATTLSGSDVGGAGGNITLNPGAGGNGAASGTTGNIILANLRGLVGVGTSSPFAKLSIGGTPPQSNTSTLVLLGNNFLSSSTASNGSGTFLGANPATGFNGDFLNFQVNSSTKFQVSSSGVITATTVSSTGITFTNATGSGNFQVGTGIFTTLASSTGITFSNATGSGNLQVTTLIATGTLAIATTSAPIGSTSTLWVCAKSNCTVPAATTSTDTVAFFASSRGTTTSTSITARGTITGGMADVGEFVKVVGDESTYQAGDVLSIAVADSISFEKSKEAYNPWLAGVVTETAGLIAGGGEDGRSRTVMALAGRVPVKVTGENGPIKQGDALTSASREGYAMKATRLGRTVAVALESFSGTTASDDGKIMALINLSWFGGNIKEGLSINESAGDIGRQALDIFQTYKIGGQASTSSELLTGRVAAELEVITPKILTNELTVSSTASINGNLAVGGEAVFTGKVTAQQIEAQEIKSPGLDYISNTLATLGNSMDDIKNRVTALENGFGVSSSTQASSSLGIDLQALLDKTGALTISGELTLKNGLKVDKIESLGETIAFMSDTVFFGRPYLNSDSGGFAVVSQGERKVEVVFDKEYVAQPVVNATISLEDNANATSTEEAIFGNGLNYLVTRKNPKGFTIVLNKPAPTDITFSWVALAVKDAKTFTFKSTPEPPPASAPLPPDGTVVPQATSTTEVSSSTSSTTPEVSSSTDTGLLPPDLATSTPSLTGDVLGSPATSSPPDLPPPEATSAPP
ncbi:MAG: hypothetical protein HY093_00540, partial [Candidatus Liptonbacteria bacterium]|nr:hypothetical protein [Candidatus Liptonbacteria bacterium]